MSSLPFYNLLNQIEHLLSVPPMSAAKKKPNEAHWLYTFTLAIVLVALFMALGYRSSLKAAQG